MSRHLSRRHWLKLMSIAAGGAALPAVASAKNEKGENLLLPQVNSLYKELDRPVTAITLGAGNRGNVYGGYSLAYPGQLDIVGVAEPIELRNERLCTQAQYTRGESL